MPIFCTYNLSSLTADCSQRMHFIARNLLRCQADLICLQEVSSIPGLLDNFPSQELLQRFPYRIHPSGNDPRGMNLAVLSRLPITAYASHSQREFPLLNSNRNTRFSRDLLAITWEYQGQNWQIFTTHLKSMRGGASAQRQRESEAAAIIDIISQQPEHCPWLLIGDLNDHPQSLAVQRLLQSGLDLRNSLPAGQTTFPCKGGRTQFDYILYPGWMEPALVTGRAWPESRASDHAMVTANFCHAQLARDLPIS